MILCSEYVQNIRYCSFHFKSAKQTRNQPADKNKRTNNPRPHSPPAPPPKKKNQQQTNKQQQQQQNPPPTTTNKTANGRTVAKKPREDPLRLSDPLSILFQRQAETWAEQSWQRKRRNRGRWPPRWQEGRPQRQLRTPSRDTLTPSSLRSASASRLLPFS